jgi:uncharacterized protein YgfB (UPF0149 family)
MPDGQNSFGQSAEYKVLSDKVNSMHDDVKVILNKVNLQNGRIACLETAKAVEDALKLPEKIETLDRRADALENWRNRFAGALALVTIGVAVLVFLKYFMEILQ